MQSKIDLVNKYLELPHGYIYYFEIIFSPVNYENGKYLKIPVSHSQGDVPE